MLVGTTESGYESSESGYESSVYERSTGAKRLDTVKSLSERLNCGHCLSHCFFLATALEVLTNHDSLK